VGFQVVFFVQHCAYRSRQLYRALLDGWLTHNSIVRVLGFIVRNDLLGWGGGLG